VHSFSVPSKIVNLPQGLSVAEPAEPTAQVTVRGVRKDATTLNAKNVVLEVSLSRAGPGEARVALTPGKLVMPESQVEVQGISPQVMVFTLQKKPDEAPQE